MTTLSDVARLAGVSLATASRALHGSPGRSVRPELRARVQKAAIELDYHPDAAAQTMARGRSNSVGLIVNDISDPFFSAVALGVTNAVARFNCIMTLSSTGVSAVAKADVVNLMAGQRVRAVILAGGVPTDDPGLEALQAALQRITSAGVRVCGIAGEVLDIDHVVLPNGPGAAALAGELLAVGHRRFAILAGPADHPSLRARADAFEQRVRQGGGEVTAHIETDLDRASGYAAMGQLLGSDLPDVVFAANDLMALGALRRLRQEGLSVPGDVGLAGFGDSEALADIVPPMTSVFVDARRAGEIAGELVLGSVDVPDQQLGYEVRLRESTRR